ncbi:unnamed protein product [Bemisia tabaci]|uniref:Ionotropic receptor n=1 Tax=Bemisia tabaci TaxID=7038 RepID=A0A9P0AQN1_BEMTA|nr:unnamed protein product [Bemisia tabaci]
MSKIPYVVIRLLQLIDLINSSVFDALTLRQPTDDKFESLVSLGFKMCLNIVNKTELKLFYMVEIKSNAPFSHFTRDLHDNGIQTISISHHSKITNSIVTDQVKNIIFVLEDAEELFDLILYTVSNEVPPELNQEMRKTQELIRYQLKGTLPRYCIKVDNHYLWLREKDTCFEDVSITSTELEDGSVLSDQVFNTVRGLYFNEIWNAKNHLIILLKNMPPNTRKSRSKTLPNETADIFEPYKSSSLMFSFKFFWRLFKGHKTVICYPDGCTRYNPFTKKLIYYQGDTDKSFPDFSWDNMHRQTVVVVDADDVRPSSSPSWDSWMIFYMIVLKHFEASVNCTFRIPSDFREAGEMAEGITIENGLKFDIALFLFSTGIITEEPIYSILDFSVSVDTSTLCIATPHSDFMPQALVIFKSYTPVVWIFILVTIVISVLVQYIFQISQTELFHRLYTDAEMDYYRGTSSLLTVYAYFICGGPPSLHLGRLYTGKILFLVFSFSTIIISTVFLSGMTTLLSNRVLYPEIDTLEALERSNLFIQASEKLDKNTLSLLDQLIQSKGMRSRFVDSLNFYVDYVYVEVIDHFLTTNGSSIGSSEVDDFSIADGSFANRTRQIAENVDAVATTDAFLINLPFSSTPLESLRVRHFHNRTLWYEYHLMEECLVTYPLIFLSLKNSFFFDKLNRMIASYLETGHAKRILEEDVKKELEFIKSEKESDEPRAFDLNDLQSAFIGLTVGLFLSFLAFVGELLSDIFKHSTAVKFLTRLSDRVGRDVRNGVVFVGRIIVDFFQYLGRK